MVFVTIVMKATKNEEKCYIPNHFLSFLTIIKYSEEILSYYSFLKTPTKFNLLNINN